MEILSVKEYSGLLGHVHHIMPECVGIDLNTLVDAYTDPLTDQTSGMSFALPGGTRLTVNSIFDPIGRLFHRQFSLRPAVIAPDTLPVSVRLSHYIGEGGKLSDPTTRIKVNNLLFFSDPPSFRYSLSPNGLSDYPVLDTRVFNDPHYSVAVGAGKTTFSGRAFGGESVRFPAYGIVPKGIMVDPHYGIVSFGT